MPTIDDELDEAQYGEQLLRRHLTDAVLRQPLSHLRVPLPVCVVPDATLQETVETMRNGQGGAILITDPVSNRLAGIFTERDLLKRVAGRGWDFNAHRISEVMTADPEGLAIDEQIGFALHMMLMHGYRHLPILNDLGVPIGIVSQRFLLNYLCEYFPEDVLNQPPRSEVTAPPKEQHGG